MLRPIALVFCVVSCAPAAEPTPRAAPPEPPPLMDAAVSQPVPSADAGEHDAGPADDAGVAGDPAPEPPPHYPFQEPMPERALAAGAVAVRYANLSAGACRTEVKKRKLAARPTKTAPKTIWAPLRIHGPFHDVRFVVAPPPSPYGILDCRLVLALDDFASVLASLGVVSVRLDNLYRPRARLPGSKKRSQHAYGLAADITSFGLSDGTTLSAENDWHAPIGAKACGPEAVLLEPTETAIQLRDLVCEVARRGIFHHLLTPSFNAAHRTHFHFDIQRAEKLWAVH